MSDERDFYKEFEERYYAPREVIRQIRSQYLPLVAPLVELFSGASVFDAGCGRGEWLELMEEMGFHAYGADLDQGMLDACRKLGLNVRCEDAIAYLQQIDTESLALVTAFHVVEHISFEDLQLFIREALRVLKAGGLLIMETPNPENIQVGTEYFYLDPTHQKPIPSRLLSFMTEYYGFYRTTVWRLNEPKIISEKERLSLWEVFSGVSPDYAVIAQKKSEEKHMDAWGTLFDSHKGISLHQASEKHELRLQMLESQMAVSRQLEETLADLSATVTRQQSELQQYHALLSSHSWKITYPLRWLNRMLKTIIRRTAAEDIPESLDAASVREEVERRRSDYEPQ